MAESKYGKYIITKPKTYIARTDFGPEEDDVTYRVKQGCCSDEEHDYGPYPSSKEVKLSHIWDEEEIYTTEVTAIDTYEVEGEPITLSVSMPKNRQIIQYPLIFKLLRNSPPFLALLRNILGRQICKVK